MSCGNHQAQNCAGCPQVMCHVSDIAEEHITTITLAVGIATYSAVPLGQLKPCNFDTRATVKIGAMEIATGSTGSVNQVF